MKNLTIVTVVIYTAFLGLIGFAVWFTNSGAPLWALLLFPGTVSMSSGKGVKKQAFELLRRVLQQPVSANVTQEVLTSDIRKFLAKHDKKS